MATEGRRPERAEVTAYFVVAEALTNVANHTPTPASSQASSVATITASNCRTPAPGDHSQALSGLIDISRPIDRRALSEHTDNRSPSSSTKPTSQSTETRSKFVPLLQRSIVDLIQQPPAAPCAVLSEPRRSPAECRSQGAPFCDPGGMGYCALPGHGEGGGRT
jgi:hypothetical protein